jgi:diguanylate cyclase (GGDEF)-like protein
VVAGVLVTAVGLLLALQIGESMDRAARRMGFEPELASDGAGPRGMLVVGVEDGLPADRAGLEPGDVMVEAGGVRIEKTADYDRVAETFDRGRSVPVVVSRDGREVRLAMTPGVPVPWVGMTLDLLALFCYLGLGLTALLSRPGDLRARLLFYFAAAVSLELVLPYDAIGSVSYLASVAYYVITGFEIGVELHLASVIPRRLGWLSRRPWLVPTYYVVGLGIGTLVAVTMVVEELWGQDLFPWGFLQVEDLLLDVGLPVWAVAIAAILLTQARSAPEARGRHQALLVFAGVLPWVAWVMYSIVLQGLGNPVSEVALAIESVALLCYPVAVFVAIFRFNLFDMELVVRRGLVYSVLTGILVLLFYLAVGLGGTMASEASGGSPSIWFVAAVTLGLGLAFAPLRRLIQRQIDRRFFPERYALRRRLVALASELPGLGKLPLMGQRLVEALQSSFDAQAVGLLIAEPNTGRLAPVAKAGCPRGPAARPILLPIEEPGIQHLYRSGRPLPVEEVSEVSPEVAARLEIPPDSLLVPLVCQDDLIGVLLVGAKPTGDRFAREEEELLALMAHHAAIVFQNARLFESATYEGLTGLLRREAILDILSRELDRAQRHRRPLTVAMADLDHFKALNDRYGHLVGDSLLKEAARVLAEGLRSTDSIGRYGGEEFLFVLPETTLAGARVVADKVRRLVEDLEVQMEDGGEAHMTVSIGLAALETQVDGDTLTARQLLAAADRALYEAKERGRNRIHPPMIASVG